MEERAKAGTDQYPSCCPFGFATSRFQQPGVGVWINKIILTVAMDHDDPT